MKFHHLTKKKTIKPNGVYVGGGGYKMVLWAFLEQMYWTSALII